MDVGCGTGQLALALDGRCREVLGVDVDAGMLDQAREAQSNSGSRMRISWLQAAAEDLCHLRNQLGVFRLVTFSRSFHWMRHGQVLDGLDALVTPQGCVAILSEGSWWTGREIWQRTIKDLIQRYLGRERRAGNGYYRVSQTSWKTVLGRSVFSQSSEYELEMTRQWNLETILGYLLSTSYASSALLGEQLSRFQQDVSAALLAIQPENNFSETVVFKLTVGFRQKLF